MQKGKLNAVIFIGISDLYFNPQECLLLLDFSIKECCLFTASKMFIFSWCNVRNFRTITDVKPNYWLFFHKQQRRGLLRDQIELNSIVSVPFISVLKHTVFFFQTNCHLNIYLQSYRTSWSNISLFNRRNKITFYDSKEFFIVSSFKHRIRRFSWTSLLTSTASVSSPGSFLPWSRGPVIRVAPRTLVQSRRNRRLVIVEALVSRINIRIKSL